MACFWFVLIVDKIVFFVSAKIVWNMALSVCYKFYTNISLRRGHIEKGKLFTGQQDGLA